MLRMRLFIARLASVAQRTDIRPSFRAEKASNIFARRYPKTARYARISRSLLEGRTEAGGGARNLPILFPDNAGKPRVTRKNPKFIGSRRRNFCFGGVYLEGFGLRIMNPPL